MAAMMVVIMAITVAPMITAVLTPAAMAPPITVGSTKDMATKALSMAVSSIPADRITQPTAPSAIRAVAMSATTMLAIMAAIMAVPMVAITVAIMVAITAGRAGRISIPDPGRFV
jgi:hypothetical protein